MTAEATTLTTLRLARAEVGVHLRALEERSQKLRSTLTALDVAIAFYEEELIPTPLAPAIPVEPPRAVIPPSPPVSSPAPVVPTSGTKAKPLTTEEVVAELRSLRSSGLSWKAVADALNARGRKPRYGEKWTAESAQNVESAASRRDGNPPRKVGRPPVGDEEQALRLAREYRDGGATWPACAAKLKALGIKTKMGLDWSAVGLRHRIRIDDRKADAEQRIAAPAIVAAPVTLVKRVCSACRKTYSGEANVRAPFYCPACSLPVDIAPDHEDFEDVPLGGRP